MKMTITVLYAKKRTTRKLKSETIHYSAIIEVEKLLKQNENQNNVDSKNITYSYECIDKISLSEKPRAKNRNQTKTE